MTRAETFYKRLHQALGLTVQKNDTLARINETDIMFTLIVGIHCLEQQQRAEAERAAQLAEVVE